GAVVAVRAERRVDHAAEQQESGPLAFAHRVEGDCRVVGRRAGDRHREAGLLRAGGRVDRVHVVVRVVGVHAVVDLRGQIHVPGGRVVDGGGGGAEVGGQVTAVDGRGGPGRAEVVGPLDRAGRRVKAGDLF